MKKALSQLQLSGMFTDLDITFLEYQEDMGDSKLKAMCESYSRTQQAHKIIFIF